MTFKVLEDGASISRPTLLVEAAQRLVALSDTRSRRSKASVIAEELEMEHNRKTNSGSYNVRRHVEVLAEYIKHLKKGNT